MKTTPLMFHAFRMNGLRRPLALLVTWMLGVSPLLAQAPGLPVPPSTPLPVTPQQARPTGGEKQLQLNFRDSPLEQVLDMVAELLGKTIIKSPGISATITLKSQSRLTVEESLQAIEAVLAMNNITLVPMGEKFLRAVQTAQARQEGMEIVFATPEEGFNDTDKLISQVFTLSHVELEEIQAVIQGLLHGYGKIQMLERANSLMITDTEANLARITELLEFLDQPVESKVETRIYNIHFAEASQIASMLNELIADSQAKEEKPQIAVAEQQPQVPTPPGVIRARQAQQAGGEVEAALQMAERGIISGKVRIIADDRTNILFVISRTENFVFFDRIVEALDVQIDPAITVRVMALEYAKAEDIASILNEFIGAAASEKEGGAPEGASDTDGGATDSRSQALRDFIRTRTQQRAAAPAAAGEVTETSIGRLSPETKILADKRTNAILMMGKLKDLSILEDLVDHLDIMLAQVVIEAVIIEVALGDDVRSGVAWLQKSMAVYNEQNVGPGGGITLRDPVASYAGGTSLGVGALRDAATLGKPEDGEIALIPGGLTWFTSLYDFNIDAIIRLAQSSRNAEILSTPVIVTTDNTEAKIIASTQRPVVTTTSTTDGGSVRSSYEYRDIGINLTVTPRVNPQRVVVMEVNQTADDVAGEVEIDGNLVPEITKRELNATVSVEDRGTIVLGGLILSRNAVTETKVPLLGDIPVLGNLFKFKTKNVQRSELVVLLTPYVLLTPAEARAESTRLYSANSMRQREWHTGWSDSAFGKMTDREKTEYIKNWEENRPEPYTRDLSIDLFSPEEGGSVPAPSIDDEEDSRPVEGFLPAQESINEVIEEVTQEEAEPGGASAPRPAPAVDYSVPVPVR